MAKVYKYKKYTLIHQDNGVVNVTKDGVEQSNSKSALNTVCDFGSDLSKRSFK